MKIYTNRVDHYFTWYCLIAAKFVQANVELVIVSEEQQQAPEFKAKKAHGKFPMLETDDGHIIFESNAIADYIAGMTDRFAILEYRRVFKMDETF